MYWLHPVLDLYTGCVIHPYYTWDHDHILHNYCIFGLYIHVRYWGFDLLILQRQTFDRNSLLIVAVILRFHKHIKNIFSKLLLALNHCNHSQLLVPLARIENHTFLPRPIQRRKLVKHFLNILHLGRQDLENLREELVKSGKWMHNFAKPLTEMIEYFSLLLKYWKSGNLEKSASSSTRRSILPRTLSKVSPEPKDDG